MTPYEMGKFAALAEFGFVDKQAWDWQQAHPSSTLQLPGAKSPPTASPNARAAGGKKPGFDWQKPHPSQSLQIPQR
jgi:hypothetical protein